MKLFIRSMCACDNYFELDNFIGNIYMQPQEVHVEWIGIDSECLLITTSNIHKIVQASAHSIWVEDKPDEWQGVTA